MAIRTKYSSLDMVRMAKFAKENPELKPIPLIKEYNNKYPEVTEAQKLANIRNWLGTESINKHQSESRIVMENEQKENICFNVECIFISSYENKCTIHENDCDDRQI